MLDLKNLLENFSPTQMAQLTTTEQAEFQALMEWNHRKGARDNLTDYYSAIPIPGAPMDGEELGDEDDNTIYYPEFLKPALHHQLILAALDDIISGRNKRLMVFMPPGAAKSTIGSMVFPTYYLGRSPNKSIIACSYNSDLAASFGRRCRQIIRSDEYYQTFGLGLNKENTAADEWRLTNGSSYNAFGLLSGVTGRRAHGIIIDDPMKGREAADSKTQRDKVYETYLSDVTTRLFPGGFIIWILTRWHDDDPVGRILPDDWDGKTGNVIDKNGEEWFVLSLEAECTRADDPLGREIGEFLWTDWFPLEHWLGVKARQNARNWSALFQQRPTPDTGLYFTTDMIQYYDWDESKPNCGAPAHLDFYGASDYATKDGEGDYTVHGVAGYDKNDQLWIVDWWRMQTTTAVWVEMVLELARKWEPVLWAEEKGQILNSVEPFLIQRMKKTKTRLPRSPMASTKSKLARSQSIRGMMEMKQVFIPRNAPWTKDLVSELLKFDGNDTNVDDQVDVMSLFGRIILAYQSSDKSGDDHSSQTPKGETERTVSELMNRHFQRKKRERDDE